MGDMGEGQIAQFIVLEVTNNETYSASSQQQQVSHAFPIDTGHTERVCSTKTLASQDYPFAKRQQYVPLQLSPLYHKAPFSSPPSPLSFPPSFPPNFILDLH